MARGRMLSKTLSTSVCFGRLFDVCPDLAEFAQSLYPLLVAHADDFGREEGDVVTVKYKFHPRSPRPESDFLRALTALCEVGLIQWYEVEGRRIFQIVKFDDHQVGLHRRTESRFPGPNGEPGRAGRPVSTLNATEADIEQYLYEHLQSGALQFTPLTITSVSRQVRRHASYIDLLASTSEGITLVIEVKRHKVTEAAISQGITYSRLFEGDVVPVIIGHGLAAPTTSAALVVVYDENWQFTTVSSFHVKSRQIALTTLPSELNLTELNRTTDQDQEQRSALRSMADMRKHLRAALHKHLNEHPNTPQHELMALVKDLGRPLGFTWNTSGEIALLISSVQGQREKWRTG